MWLSMNHTLLKTEMKHHCLPNKQRQKAGELNLTPLVLERGNKQQMIQGVQCHPTPVFQQEDAWASQNNFWYQISSWHTSMQMMPKDHMLSSPAKICREGNRKEYLCWCALVSGTWMWKEFHPSSPTGSDSWFLMDNMRKPWKLCSHRCLMEGRFWARPFKSSFSPAANGWVKGLCAAL